jgi:hypothetical protein
MFKSFSSRMLIMLAFAGIGLFWAAPSQQEAQNLWIRYQLTHPGDKQFVANLPATDRAVWESLVGRARPIPGSQVIYGGTPIIADLHSNDDDVQYFVVVVGMINPWTGDVRPDFGAYSTYRGGSAVAVTSLEPRSVYFRYNATTGDWTPQLDGKMSDRIVHSIERAYRTM